MVPASGGVVYYTQGDDMGLPLIKIETLVKNPALFEELVTWKEKGCPEEDAPEYYVRREVLCEVVSWHIEKGSMRVRLLNDDGTPYRESGRRVTKDVADNALREDYELNLIRG